MSFQESRYIPRMPRHVSNEQVPVVVLIERNSPAQPTVRAELQDLSRDGMQLEIAEPLFTRGEEVTAGISHPALRLPVEGRGVIRWQRQNPRGTWSIGCQFNRQMSWEMLGELFLSGLLSREPPKPQA